MPWKLKSHADRMRALNRANVEDRERRRLRPGGAEAAALRSSGRWQKVRALHLKREPLCRDPFGDHRTAGRTEAGAQVHHVKAVAQYPHLAFVRENLASLCVRCHARVEARERRGDSCEILFAGGRSDDERAEGEGGSKSPTIRKH